jgi:hypothetical protein
MKYAMPRVASLPHRTGRGWAFGQEEWILHDGRVYKIPRNLENADSLLKNCDEFKFSCFENWMSLREKRGLSGRFFPLPLYRSFVENGHTS